MNDDVQATAGQAINDAAKRRLDAITLESIRTTSMYDGQIIYDRMTWRRDGRDISQAAAEALLTTQATDEPKPKEEPIKDPLPPGLYQLHITLLKVLKSGAIVVRVEPKHGKE